MADRPILFSAPMVLAQLREVEAPGTGKTQTRRVLKTLRGFGTVSEFGPSDTPGYDWHFRDKEARWNDLRHAELLKVLPYAVGDRLWARETLFIHNGFGTPLGLSPQVREGDNARVWSYGADNIDADEDRRGVPAIHMPRAFSRLTDTVTDVRVQRLQEINLPDLLHEGVVWSEKWNGFIVPGVAHPDRNFPVLSRGTAREMYAALWDVINGSGAWLANPWVVAVTFTVEQRTIDA